MDDGAIIYSGPGADEVTDDHEGYVAGRHRDQSCSDIWTDVSRSAPGTFLGYLPACECGWRGAGYQACQRAWLDEHFAAAAPQRRNQPGSRLPATLRPEDFDWGHGLDRLITHHTWNDAGRPPCQHD